MIWCINGIPEESLLHRDTLLKRLEVFAKWKFAQMIFDPKLIVTVSGRMRDYLCRKFPKSRGVNIPLCVDLGRFGGSREINRRFFTYSGSGAPWQNLMQLSEVWGCIHQLDPEIKFRVISRDPRARVLAQNLPSKSIEFVGTSDLDELAQWLLEAEVGFLLRKNTLVNRVSFPTKLSEYLASGAWVVGSDIDWDVAEIMKKYRTGILIDPELSSIEIAEKILQRRNEIQGDPDLDSRLNKAAEELGKPYWLKAGKEMLEKSMLLSSKIH